MIAGRGPLLRIWVPSGVPTSRRLTQNSPAVRTSAAMMVMKVLSSRLCSAGEAVLFHEIAAAVDDQRQAARHRESKVKDRYRQPFRIDWLPVAYRDMPRRKPQSAKAQGLFAICGCGERGEPPPPGGHRRPFAPAVVGDQLCNGIHQNQSPKQNGQKGDSG